MGLANRVVPTGTARAAAEALAAELAALPPTCLRSDRASVYEQAGLPLAEAMAVELRYGLATLASGRRWPARPGSPPAPGGTAAPTRCRPNAPPAVRPARGPAG